MRLRAGIALLLIFMAGIAYVFSNLDAVALDGTSEIDAGDAWELFIEIPDADAKQDVRVTMVNGFRVMHETLSLGSGGVAVWRIPEGQITQAGTSRYTVRYGDEAIEQTLRVNPITPSAGDLFSSANALPAYGAGSATIMLLPRDKWGNPPADERDFTMQIRYPDGERETRLIDYRDGLGRLNYQSEGAPGRVRLSVEEGLLSASLEIFQTPAEPDAIALSLVPNCVLDGGRDVFGVVADVTDVGGFAVADGTLVNFRWDGGVGYGRTIDGQATLRLPAPDETGFYSYSAGSGEAVSEVVRLRVTDGVCSGVR